jgi:hypothetical protein
MPCELTCPGEGPSCGRLRDLSSVCPSQVSGLIASHRSAPSSRPTRRKHASDRRTQAAIVSIGWRLRCHRAMHSAAWARRARAARGDRRSRRGVGCTPPHARSRVASAVRSSVVSKTGLSRVRSGRRARQRSRRMWCRAPPRRTLSPSRRASRPSPHGGLLRAGTRLIKYKLANATRDNTIDSLDAIL